MHFDPDLIVVAPATLVIAGMAYSLIRRWIDRAEVSKTELRAIDDRLARIEQAVETMSLEVERVSEGQRFATRMLAERAGETVRAGG